MAVKVQFEIGHTSKLRSKKTVEGFTHDWELYVKGVQQADISAFVEKIIFNLHESFQKPKRVCSKPPYVIQESGYAGFIVFIDIYFRNRDEPKKVQFNYDLDLQQTGPPQHRHDIKTFIFDNPSEEYRLKLLKGGGVPVSGVVAGSQPTINNNTNSIIVPMSNTVNINHPPGDGHKALTVEVKKHKSRPDDTRSSSFANLFGTPITKTSAIVATAATKHSPDNKIAVVSAHASHQTSAGTTMPVAKEKSTKDRGDKPSEKSKDRTEKREKHHKQSLTSPNKEGRSESKKSDGNKHEKRDKTEEKSKKDKSRDKERERDRDKTSGANPNNNSNSSKRLTSPKLTNEHSPHKSMATTAIAPANSIVNNTNSLPRPSSSNSGKLEEISKSTSKSSKDVSAAEIKSKESKQKESLSSSSGKKSKKEKKDKDKERDREKRHEEREKQKLAENQQRANIKEDVSKVNINANTHTNNANSIDSKNSKPTPNTLNTNISNDIGKKPEKLVKQDVFKTSGDKTAVNNNASLAPQAATNNSSSNSTSEKKSSSSSSLNSNSNPPEKDKRSHKHKKKEKNKDKDKDKDRDKERERDKERDKDKDRERDKDKDKEKEKDVKREKETKEKQAEEKITETLSLNPQNTNATKALHAPAINNTEPIISLNTTVPTTTTLPTASTPYATTTAITTSASSASSNKSSKSKDKKSKDKSTNKDEKAKRKANDTDTSESKTKQTKLSSSNSVHASSSLPAASSSSNVALTVANTTTNPPNCTQPAVTALAKDQHAEKNLNLDLSDTDSLPTVSVDQMTPVSNSTLKKPSLQPSPIITHSESSNSSFPDLQLPKQQPPSKPVPSRERTKPFTAPAAVASSAPPPPPLVSSASKDHPKATKLAAKEKPVDKPHKEEEKEKKKRRNSQAVNTFIEPPIKQLKAKDQSKSIREKSKSPSLRNTGSRASISTEASNTFLQPSASPSSTTAAAPLPPPSSAPSASHSPALSATEAVGNATSATANAATCNSNSTTSSAANSTAMAAPLQLPLDYLSELQELHHKIMTLQDNEDLQHVVELIAATGCYEITTKTFDFDLCKLDRVTVQRLQEFFATSVS